jgi:nitrous oxidase accessory protein NosD
MSRKLVATSAVFALMLGLAGVASPAAARAGDTILVTTTIQAAVDAAQPGDTILVPPGTYRESVLVTKSHLTITGSPAAVIDAPGTGRCPPARRWRWKGSCSRA